MRPTNEAAPRTPEILVVYYSRFGVLKVLAERIAEGARRVENVGVRFLEVEDRPVEELRPGESQDDMARRRAVIVNELAAADALIVGAPAYFGSMASPVKRLFEDCATASDPTTTDRSRPWRQHRFRNKVGAAFTASGTPHGGNEQTLHSILTMLMHLGMIVVTPGQRQSIQKHQASPYGATAISGPDGSRPPSQEEQDAARELGEQVAEVATWLHEGRSAWEQRRRDQERPPADSAAPVDPSA
jgi:NAD(P)H dehydrogenase (quinone)